MALASQHKVLRLAARHPNQRAVRPVHGSIVCPRLSNVAAAAAPAAVQHDPVVVKDLDEPLPGFHSIKEALADMAAGKFLVVLDDENRENEGDLICAADKVGADACCQVLLLNCPAGG